MDNTIPDISDILTPAERLEFENWLDTLVKMDMLYRLDDESELEDEI